MADTPSAHSGCGLGEGVTVVVDSSDIGGTVEVSCAADDPGNGRAALSAAGFAATDSSPGLICAIDAKPDPCPTTFEGSYWSYWHAQPGQAWVSYQVGADSSNPAPGEVEGWRYNDGSTGPSITASAAASQTAPATSHSPVPLHQVASGADGALGVSVVAGAVLVLLIVAAIAYATRRRTASRSAEPDYRHDHDESN
ncbi:MAG: hypothetical protein ABI275_05360 [Terrimesophilobacter sp.]